jgi:hypothetical protein
MKATPSNKQRERSVLSKVLNRARPGSHGLGKGGIMGPFDPYMKTMVPVPPYMTTGSPTPSDSTSVNYSRKGNGDQKAGQAISKYEQFDRSPRMKERANGKVGKVNDEKNLKTLGK